MATATSSLFERIKKDLEVSVRNRESARTETLRLLSAALHNKEIEKRGKGSEPVLNEEEVLDVVAKEVKKRKEATGLYIQGGRKDLADKETNELHMLEAYLPAQMSEAEVKKVIQGVVARMKAEKNFGKLMGEAMKELKGKADAMKVSAILKVEMAK